MLKNEFFKIEPKELFKKNFVYLSFDLKISNIPNELINDDEFIFDDEIILVNIGEKEKFTSDYIYQSKLVVFKDEDKINFGGYTPDFRRKGDLIKDKNGNTKFDVDKTYHVDLKLSKYRVYININNGEMIDTYGNGRDEIIDVKFYKRNGVEAEVFNVEFYEDDKEYEIKDKTLNKMVNDGIFCNYLYHHVDEYGVYFDRLNIIQNIKCTTRNSGQYSSNVILDMYTDSTKVGIEYEIMDSEVPNYEMQLGFLVNSKKRDVEIKKVNKFDSFYEEFIIGNKKEANRVTIVLPTCFSVAVRKIVLDDGSRFKKIDKKDTIIFLGDSITEGSECFDPAYAYFNQVTMAYNFNAIDMAVSGRTFNDYNLLGEYDINPKYIILANGTNSFCMGTGNKEEQFKILDRDMTLVINDCHKYFKDAKIIALLPIWRSDEIGPNYTLKETTEKMVEVYSRYEDIKVIDCYNYIPFDAKYFSNATLALHPNSDGHKIYGEKLLVDLKKIIGNPPLRNDKEDAKIALK